MKKWAWLWIGVVSAGWCQPTNAQTQPSAWKVDEKVDKLDGGKTITLTVTSIDTLEHNGRRTSPGTLIIRCTAYGTDISINGQPTLFGPDLG